MTKCWNCNHYIDNSDISTKECRYSPGRHHNCKIARGHFEALDAAFRVIKESLIRGDFVTTLKSRKANG